mgnify:CR=1 FL=1
MADSNYINKNEITVLLVRSATKVRKDIIDNCSTLKIIGRGGVGMDNIDVDYAREKGLHVINTPAASSRSVAELVFAHLFSMVRYLFDANQKMPLEGETKFKELKKSYGAGTEVKGKTIGIIGTGNIGSVMAKIMNGFGCKILANDLQPDTALVELCSVEYTSLEDLCKKCDIITLHIPLSYENHQLINKRRLGWMKKEAILINTSRGAIVEHKALIHALETRQLGGYCADVYEKENGVYFKDNSDDGIKDEQLKKLLSFSNVLLTPHQAFVTTEALENIAKITIQNLNDFEEGKTCKNEIGYETLIL